MALNTIRALPLFSDLTAEEAALLASSSRIQQYARGKFVFHHGDKITHFHVVCRGTVQLFRETPDGHEVTSDILIAGDLLNADEIIARQTIHVANARAVDDVALLEVPIGWLREHLKDFDKLAPKIMSNLSDRLQNAQVEAEHRATMSAAQIVACYLQKLCVLYNFDPRGFDLPYSKTLIASRLRMELETFSRTLQKLKDQGIIVEGTHVSFVNSQKASHFACGDCSLSEDCPTHQHLHEQLEKNSAPGCR